MKKIGSIIIVIIMLCSCISGCNSDESKSINDKSKYRIALITTTGEVNDHSFAQEAYEAGKEFGKKNDIDFNFFKPVPANGSDIQKQDKISACEKAIDKGYNVILLPGYDFAAVIAELAEYNSDVLFVGADISRDDFKAYKLDEIPKNASSFVFKEVISGFLAGYTAVKLGYTKLGFLGGAAAKPVIRFGYGYIQGCDIAAKELNKKIDMNYVYAGQYFASSEITSVMDTWYGSGTQIVFSCGGVIYASAASAAQKHNDKIIGVDSDQSYIIDADYGKNMTVTSALKSIKSTYLKVLDDVINKDKWSDYSGKISNLGLVSDKNLELNYVGLPIETTHWNDKFKKKDYKTLVSKILKNKYKIDDSCDINKPPKVSNSKIVFQGTILNSN